MGYSRTMFTRRKKPFLLRRRALLLALIFCLWLMGFLRMILVPNYNIFLSSWWMWTLTSWKQGSCTPIRRFRYEPSVSKYDPFIAVSVISGTQQQQILFNNECMCCMTLVTDINHNIISKY